MALVNCLTLMEDAQAHGRAVPAFNIDNLESALAVSEVMHEMRIPLIVQTIPRTLAYGGRAVYSAMMAALMKDCDVDYAMHLDHGSSALLARECIDNGYSSVMFDGSAYRFTENIRLTREVTTFALPLGISVEGELGVIGGKEEGNEDLESRYTKVSEAADFVAATDVSILAIGVGTAHGVYKGTPKINIRRIEEIHSAVSTPLVLHGASGLSNELLTQCIRAGISKINFATELRQAYTSGIKDALNSHFEVYDPKIYMRDAVDSIKKVLYSKIEVCCK